MIKQVISTNKTIYLTFYIDKQEFLKKTSRKSKIEAKIKNDTPITHIISKLENSNNSATENSVSTIKRLTIYQSKILGTSICNDSLEISKCYEFKSKAPAKDLDADSNT